MKKLLKNKKLLFMSLGSVLLGTSIVATAAACAPKTTTSEEPKVDAENNLTFKLNDESVKEVKDLKVTLIKEDGKSKVVFASDNQNAEQGMFTVKLTEAPANNDRIVITSKQFKTSFVYNNSK